LIDIVNSAPYGKNQGIAGILFARPHEPAINGSFNNQGLEFTSGI
jgi:hypothetical protein